MFFKNGILELGVSRKSIYDWIEIYKGTPNKSAPVVSAPKYVSGESSTRP